MCSAVTSVTHCSLSHILDFLCSVICWSSQNAILQNHLDLICQYWVCHEQYVCACCLQGSLFLAQWPEIFILCCEQRYYTRSVCVCVTMTIERASWADLRFATGLKHLSKLLIAGSPYCRMRLDTTLAAVSSRLKSVDFVGTYDQGQVRPSHHLGLHSYFATNCW